MIQSLNTENSSLTKEIYELQQKLGVISFENDKLKEQFIKIETEYQQHKMSLIIRKSILPEKSQEVESTKNNYSIYKKNKTVTVLLLLIFKWKKLYQISKFHSCKRAERCALNQNQVLGHEKPYASARKSADLWTT